jgi:putative endopeptidase
MRRLKEDVHSPGDARVNVPLFNIETFYKAFSITEKDKLFRPVSERALIW